MQKHTARSIYKHIYVIGTSCGEPLVGGEIIASIIPGTAVACGRCCSCFATYIGRPFLGESNQHERVTAWPSSFVLTTPQGQQPYGPTTLEAARKTLKIDDRLYIADINSGNAEP